MVKIWRANGSNLTLEATIEIHPRPSNNDNPLQNSTSKT
jgi:hypothetical protein